MKYPTDTHPKTSKHLERLGYFCHDPGSTVYQVWFVTGLPDVEIEPTNGLVMIGRTEAEAWGAKGKKGGVDLSDDEAALALSVKEPAPVAVAAPEPAESPEVEEGK